LDATQREENTTYCGSCLTCPTESGIFASAANEYAVTESRIAYACFGFLWELRLFAG
jgi:hypothetical protein